MNYQNKILVLDYDPNWAVAFEKLKMVLNKYLKNDIIAIEHVGSTSVIGLKAKPIIDIDIIIENDDLQMEKALCSLNKLGYLHLGNLGITGREAFKKLDAKTPNDGSNTKWFKHNLYLCKKDSIGLLNHLNFRDYLRNNSNKVVEYGQLKQDLAAKFPYNIDAYIDGKTEFITAILRKTGMKEADAETIGNENKLK